jgi:hypothetical protein
MLGGKGEVRRPGRAGGQQTTFSLEFMIKGTGSRNGLELPTSTLVGIQYLDLNKGHARFLNFSDGPYTRFFLYISCVNCEPHSV